MPLQSKHFRGDAKLEAALISDPAHIKRGDHGDHVAKIQAALILLDGAQIATDGSYGPRTAAAVMAYKTKRSIINTAYQATADDIVGRMTMARLDQEMLASENTRPPEPTALRSFLNYSPVLRSVFAGNRVLKKGPPFSDREAVRLVQGGLKSLNLPVTLNLSFKTGAPDGIFGTETEAGVKAFQQHVAFRDNPALWDGIVDRGTLGFLDSLLPGQVLPIPENLNVLRPPDILVYISGNADSVNMGGVVLKQGDSTEFNDLLTIPARPGFPLLRVGIGGSNTTSLAVAQVTRLILNNHVPGSGARIILYGYSVGAKQLLEVCGEVEKVNRPPNFAAIARHFYHINLLITIDAASGLSTIFMDRTVAGCVRINQNWFQTTPTLRLSAGGPAIPAHGASGNFPTVFNDDVTAQLPGQRNKHDEINEKFHPQAVVAIKKMLS